MKDTDRQSMSLQCSACGEDTTVHVAGPDLGAFRTGAKLVQEAFPYLTDDERELFVSGICGKCFDALSPDGHEEAEDGVAIVVMSAQQALDDPELFRALFGGEG